MNQFYSPSSLSFPLCPTRFLHHQFPERSIFVPCLKCSLQLKCLLTVCSPIALLKLFPSMVTWSHVIIFSLTTLSHAWSFSILLSTVAYLLHLEKLPLTFKMQQCLILFQPFWSSSDWLPWRFFLLFSPLDADGLRLLMAPFPFPLTFPPLMISCPAIAAIIVCWIDDFLALDSHLHLATEHFHLLFSK